MIIMINMNHLMTVLAQSHLYEGDDESIEEADEEVEDDEDGSEDEEDDEGDSFKCEIQFQCPNNFGPAFKCINFYPVAPSLSRHTDITDDTASISTTNSKSYKTIQLLPSTSINYGSDESSDEANPLYVESFS